MDSKKIIISIVFILFTHKSQSSFVNPDDDLLEWLFKDKALSAKITAEWKQKDCNNAAWKKYYKNCMHTGIDINAPLNTPIYSVCHGKVIRVKHGSDCQNLECLSLVAIYNQLINTTFLYLHIRDIAVKEGTEIKAGDLIGKVGMRGPSTGPHLHFEARKGKAYAGSYDADKTLDPFEQAKLARSSIPVKPTTWKEFILGDLIYSIPSDWKVYKETAGCIEVHGKSPLGIQRSYYKGELYELYKGEPMFVIGMCEEESDCESGSVRIIHTDECGREIVEEPIFMHKCTKTISRIGCIINYFRTKIAGYPVLVRIYSYSKGASDSLISTYPVWSVYLFSKRKFYYFEFYFNNSESHKSQRDLFDQFTSRIRFLR